MQNATPEEPDRHNGFVPEGDTIHRTALRLRPALAGKSVRSFSGARLIGAGPAAGTPIEDVEAKGKYLLVHFGDGTTLETHMKMSGSWHIYRSGERWRRSAGAARAVIETMEGWVAVCFSAPHVKLIKTPDGRQHLGPGRSASEHLGPDLCAESPDLEAAVRRFSLREPETPLAVALLDQRICCGVGNVYKSEVLFACKLHPETPIGSVDQASRSELVATANAMLRNNLGSGPRVTATIDGRPGLAVYGRRGLPCISCAQPIEYGVHGIHARSSYWCPSCQPSASAEPSSR